jgi:gluconokinase
MLVLSLDIGTSSTRAALFDEQGRRIGPATAQRAYPLLTDREGRAEIEPERLLAAVRWCVGRVIAAKRADRRLRGREILGVGASCFWHSLIGVDLRGEPLTRVLTWADSRCSDEAARLRAQHDERALHARTGCMLRASFALAKLSWFARAEPRACRRVRRWVSPAEWIYERLCGGVRCAHGMATGTGLYDPARRDWDEGALDIAGVRRDQLNPIGDHELLPERARIREWPELAEARWFPAIGDGAANNLGAGATRPGWAAINFGTSAAVRVMRDSGTPRAPFGLFCYRVDERRFLLGGAISNAGSLRAWCVDQLRLPEDTALERALAARRGPGHGLRVLPFWLAERAPSWRDDLAGAIVGIRHSTTALDLLQAITEASFHRLATIVELLPDARTPRFVVGGGLQRSPASLQRLADVLGRPLLPAREAELSLRGAAVFALERLGLGAPMPPLGAAVLPRREVARAYVRERTRMAELERTLYPAGPPSPDAPAGERNSTARLRGYHASRAGRSPSTT